MFKYYRTVLQMFTYPAGDFWLELDCGVWPPLFDGGPLSFSEVFGCFCIVNSWPVRTTYNIYLTIEQKIFLILSIIYRMKEQISHRVWKYMLAHFHQPPPKWNIQKYKKIQNYCEHIKKAHTHTLSHTHTLTHKNAILHKITK